jgi:hypothetical protein
MPNLSTWIRLGELVISMNKIHLTDAPSVILQRFKKRFTYRRLYCLMVDGILPFERAGGRQYILDLDNDIVIEILGLDEKIAA